MALPKNITKEHLLKAIEKIEIDGIPNEADSQYYDVVYKGKNTHPRSSFHMLIFLQMIPN